jgi:glycerophosphoryl diester phosphodiesterase
MRYSRHLRQLDGLFDRPIAHRGLHRAHDGIVENTESAFAAAIAGHYAIECDVQLSSDGEAMVFHDDRLERLTESSGPVAARST